MREWRKASGVGEQTEKYDAEEAKRERLVFHGEIFERYWEAEYEKESSVHWI